MKVLDFNNRRTAPTPVTSRFTGTVYTEHGARWLGTFPLALPMTSARHAHEFAEAKRIALGVMARVGGTSIAIAEDGVAWPVWCGFFTRVTR